MDARDLSGPRAVDGVPDIASHRPTPLGRCGCGVDVHAGSFRDRLSYREWWIRPACQDCQDRLYLARDPDTGEPLPLRRRAIVAARDQDFAALPFRWTVPPMFPDLLPTWSRPRPPRAPPRWRPVR